MRNFLRRWLGITDLEKRTADIERHFVTRRDQNGKPVETLADVPVTERKEREVKMRGMSVDQRRRWLEETDGGRNLG